MFTGRVGKLGMQISKMMVKGYNSALPSFQSRFTHAGTCGGNKPPAHVATYNSRKNHKRSSTVRMLDFAHCQKVKIDVLNNALQDFGTDNIVKCNGRHNNIMMLGSKNSIISNGSNNHITVRCSGFQFDIPGSNQHIDIDICGKMTILECTSNEIATKPANMLKKLKDIAKNLTIPGCIDILVQAFS